MRVRAQDNKTLQSQNDKLAADLGKAVTEKNALSEKSRAVSGPSLFAGVSLLCIAECFAPSIPTDA